MSACISSSSSKRQKKDPVEISLDQANMPIIGNTPTVKTESCTSELNVEPLLKQKRESLQKKLIGFGSYESSSSSLCSDLLTGSTFEPDRKSDLSSQYEPASSSSLAVNLPVLSSRGFTDKGMTKPGKLFQWDYLLKEMVSCGYLLLLTDYF